MFITYLKLENYKRFPLSNVEVFEKEFDKKMTIITGPNGSGKSSLISELTPLPTSKDNFFENGYKEIHIRHKDQSYRLICDFRSHSKFYFYLNEVNLNLSFNVTMQKDLVQEHFGITQVIHELLTGIESFTEMTLLNRKKLIHAITHLNIDSIIANYDKLKEELKSFEFLHKNLTGQLVAERHKLADKDAVNRLNTQLNLYRQHIDHLLSMRQELYRYTNSQNLEQSFQALQSLETLYRDITSKHYVQLTAYPFSSVQNSLQQLQIENTYVTNSLRALYSKLEKLQDEKKTFSLSNSKSIADIQLENDRIQLGIQRRVSDLQIFKDLDLRVQDVLSALQLLESSLPEVLEKLPTNADRKYSKPKYEELLNRKNFVLTELNKNLHELSRQQAEYKELQKHKELNCPNCNHNWLPKEVDNRLKELQVSIRTIEEKQFNYQTEITQLDKEIDAQVSYLNQLSLFNNIYSSTKTLLAPLWSIVSQKGLLYNDPQQIIITIRTGAQDCISHLSIQDLTEQLNNNLSLIKRITELTHNNQKSIDDELSQIEIDILALQVRQDSIKQNIKSIEYIGSVHETSRKLKKAISLSSSNLSEAVENYVVVNLNKEIDSELSLTKVSLLEIEKEISKQGTIELTISRLEAQLEEVNEHIKVLTILTDELSPKNGYIAKTISNYLNVLIERLNAIIASVWDYKMVIKPINIGDDALNYKFKVEVEDKLPIADIVLVSKGMQEMINLAMKITLYKLLGLEDYPIYLDEYGDKLDKHHKAKIADIVFRMIGSPVYSQIFLISHIDMSYAQFKDTEVLEM